MYCGGDFEAHPSVTDRDQSKSMKQTPGLTWAPVAGTIKQHAEKHEKIDLALEKGIANGDYQYLSDEL
ncbi:uncharacterized protein N7500_010155 [Penicillium coprophilum]|uniref:uncharacterized protein n=1 Tax=Penicillium coprophilum TaxID=36646 RepID=UPI00238F818E|nr:uncharacterized protein N7500_010155 [Penicillium coprophilum]KAJ5154716.1 hypothetical protein N7500_010155 [Penicillium coprophilum]